MGLPREPVQLSAAVQTLSVSDVQARCLCLGSGLQTLERTHGMGADKKHTVSKKFAFIVLVIALALTSGTLGFIFGCCSTFGAL